MAYYSGQASSYQDLRNVLVNACVEQGWAWAQNILSKNNLFLNLTIHTTNGIALQAGTDLSLSNKSPLPVYTSGIPGINPVTFPVSYFLHCFDNEIYLIFKHSLNIYNYLAFGFTDQNLWYTSQRREGLNNAWSKLSISNIGAENNLYACPAPFWTGGTWTIGTGFNSYVYNKNLGWFPKLNDTSSIGISALGPLVERLPSAWSSESILLPISLYASRESNKNSLLQSLENSRFMRIDNYNEESIIILGNDKWKIYPFYKKNTIQRNGGTGIEHSGTFGWAIRYDGP